MNTNQSPENGDGSGSKVPKFLKIICDSGIQRLRLPTEFTQKQGHRLENCVSLKVPSGLEWKVELIHSFGEIWLQRGWQQFEEYYSIFLGHLLLFEYVGNSHFLVHIFDSTATEIEYFHYDSLNRGFNQAAEVEEFASDSDESVVFLKETFVGKDAESKYQDDVNEDTRSHVWEKKRRMQECDELHPVKSRKSSREDQHSSSPHYLHANAILLEDERSEGAKLKYTGRKRDVNNSFEAYTRALAYMSEKPTRTLFSIVVMQPSYVKTKYPCLNLPTPFAREVLPGRENSLILHVSEGKTWVVRCVCSKVKAIFTSGWQKFVKDNDLKVGDVCVFEVVEKINLTWNVIIFRD